MIILFIIYDLVDIEVLCECVVMLDEGSIIYDGLL